MKAHNAEITVNPQDTLPRAPKINRAASIAVMVLSLIALLTVLSGYTHPPDPDEGSAAHIFQLSIASLMPTLLLYLATANWKQPQRIARPLAFPAAALMIAFGMLYYLEHYYR